MKKCPHCGAQLQENAGFCLFCMRSLEEKTDVTPAAPGRGRAWLISAVACLLLLVAGTAFWLLSQGAGTEQSQTGSACDHNYAPATCLTPKTCTLCGHAEGGVDESKHAWRFVSGYGYICDICLANK